jgi:four helix bundle protein
MANCSIPNSSPESGRISRKSSRRLRRQNSQSRAAVSVIRRLESRIQKRHRVRHSESVLWQTAALQTALRAQKIQSTVGNRADGIGETEGKAAMGSSERTGQRASFNLRSAIWRVKGAWWPSRSSKPSSSCKWRGRFDSYPLRLFNCELRIADRGLKNWVMTTQELKNRTFEFGVRVISAVEALPKTETARILGRQLLRAGTSVGANYRAAARARSQADFISKLGVVEEECDESAYWMEMILARKLLRRAQLTHLLAETNELLAITVASIRTARRGGRRDR